MDAVPRRIDPSHPSWTAAPATEDRRPISFPSFPPLFRVALVVLTIALAAAPVHAQSVDNAGGRTADKTDDATSAPDVPFAARPYRVSVTIAFGRSVELAPHVRGGVVEDLRGIIERTFGPVWNAEVAEDAMLFPATAAGLERLSAESLVADPDADPFDKRYVLTVEQADGVWQVAGREWDAATRTLGGTRSVSSPDRRALAEAAGRVLAASFRPSLAVRKVDGDRIAFELQAGVFSVPDAAGIALGPGDVLMPYFRYLDREGIVRRIQFLPFTWLSVDDVQGHRVSATVISGLRSPLGTGRRRQVELGAIVVRPHLDSTRVRLVPRTNPERPLVAHRVALMKKRLVHDAPREEPVEMLSDRRGEIEVPLDRDDPLTWVYVWSGEALLARFPIVPGVVAAEIAELPDDSVRLALEGELAILEADLVDTVAVRAVLLARMRQQGQAGLWDEYNRLSGELDQLPRQARFESRLNIARQNALRAARAQNSRVLESRVNRQCARLQRLVAKYLDLGEVSRLREEMQENRRVDRAAAAP